MIEAAQSALGIAPGLSRGFGFERLIDFDRSGWAALRAEAVRRVQAAPRAARPGLRIAASDSDPRAIEQTRRNAERAGVPAGTIELSVRDATQAPAPFETPGVIVTNPPYGERIDLDAQAGADWPAIGAALRQRFGGWSAWVLSSDMELPRRLGIRERRRTPLYNGALECRLFGFEIFEPGAIRPRRGARSPG